MITLQDLIDYANEQGLQPSECKMLLGEKCADGDIKHDYLYKLRVANNEKVVNHRDEIDTVKTGLVMEILPW